MRYKPVNKFTGYEGETPSGFYSCNSRIDSQGAEGAVMGVYHELVFHFVWATKQRAPLITPAVEQRLLPYIVNKCRELGYTLIPSLECHSDK